MSFDNYLLNEVTIKELVDLSTRSHNLFTPRDAELIAFSFKYKNAYFKTGKYYQTIKFDDIKSISRLKGSDKEKVEMAFESDIKVNCNCFTGDTKIKLLDGTSKRIDSFDVGEEIWVYSCKENGTIVPALAKNLGVTKKVNKLLKLTLDNNETITCTLDHPFMLNDGTYKNAENLTSGDSLMPGYFKDNDNGYEMIFDNKKKKYITTHKMVALGYESLIEDKIKTEIFINESEKDKFPVIHHRDFNKRNNEPSNLKYMGHYEHWMYHAKMGSDVLKKLWKDPEYRKMMIPILAANGKKTGVKNLRNGYLKWKDENTKLAYLATVKGGQNSYKSQTNTPEKLEAHKDRMQKINKQYFESGGHSTEHTKFLSDHMTKLNNSVESRERTALMNKDPKVKLNQMKGRVFSTIRKMKNENIDLNINNYIENKGNTGPTENKVLELFESWDNLIFEFEHNNHNIISIEYLDVNDIPVYDLNVPSTSNFLLDSGIFVHNCPDFLYGGFKYMGTIMDYSIYKEHRPPKIKNPNEDGTVCKHLSYLLEEMPLFLKDIVDDIQTARDNNYRLLVHNKEEFKNYKKGKTI